MMGGDVGVESTEGAGSVFWFTAWLEQGEAVAVTAAAGTATAKAALQNDYTGARILLVEDDPINQEVAVALLEDAGLAVDTADDGVAAVGLAAGDYDVILMDLQ